MHRALLPKSMRLEWNELKERWPDHHHPLQVFMALQSLVGRNNDVAVQTVDGGHRVGR